MKKYTKYGYVSKGELAMRYAPDMEPHSAVNRLMMWLKKDKATMDALYETGYRKKQKVFTPKQVKIIMEFLGEP